MTGELWKNPYVLAGAALLFILIVVGRKASSGGADASAGLASQQIATSGNIQLTGLGAQLVSTNSQANAAVAISNNGLTATLFGTALGLLGKYNDNATALDVTRANVSSSIKINANNNATYATLAPQLATINANNLQALAGIDSTTKIAIADKQLAATYVNADVTKFVAGAQEATATRVAQEQAAGQRSIANAYSDAATNQAIAGGLTSVMTAPFNMGGSGRSSGGGSSGGSSPISSIMSMFSGLLGGSGSNSSGGGSSGGASSVAPLLLALA